MRLLRATKKRPHWRVEFRVGKNPGEPMGVLLPMWAGWQWPWERRVPVEEKIVGRAELLVRDRYRPPASQPVGLIPSSYVIERTVEFVSIALVPKREPRSTILPDHVLDGAAREQMREACGERGAARFGISGGETSRYRVTEAWLANEAVRRGCLDPGAWVEGMPWAEVEGCEVLEQLSPSQLGALFDIVDAWRGMTAEELEAEELAHAEWTREQRPDTELASRRTQPKGDDQ